MRLCRLFARDRRGVHVVEQAAILPVFMILIIGLIEVSWQFAVTAALDSGARRGTRWAALGLETGSSDARLNRLTQIILTSSGLPLRDTALQVTAVHVSSHSDLRNFEAGECGSQPGRARCGVGGPNDIVQFTIRYNREPLIPVSAPFFTGFRTVYTSVVIVQNEPFPIAR